MDETIVWDTPVEPSSYFDIQNLIVIYNNAKDKVIKDILLELIKKEKELIDDLMEEHHSTVLERISKNKRKKSMKRVK